MASTGLKSLSLDFGRKMPNLRILNLNYNALRDLRSLLGIVRLQKVYLAENRISRLRQTSMILRGLGPGLEEVDLRRNPLTVGFYTPQDSTLKQEKQIALRDSRSASKDINAESAKAYLLPAMDKTIDAQSRARLDEDTKLRRRVYETLILNSCKGLKTLDGLEAQRKFGAANDEIMERLCELRILKDQQL